MKKVVLYTIMMSLLLNSCGSSAGDGAYVGATLGSVLGSAIGGISDGPRGHDMGTLIGMAGGAVVGGAIGAIADRQDRQERHEHYERIQQQKAQEQQTRQQEVYVDDTNSGDDRIDDFTLGPANNSVESVEVSNFIPKVEVRHAVFTDDSGDGILQRDEEGKVVFEVYNISSQPVSNLELLVVESTGNKYVHVSPPIFVELVAPHRGVRYTATVKVDHRGKNGSACLQTIVRQNGQLLVKPVEFTVDVRKH